MKLLESILGKRERVTLKQMAEECAKSIPIPPPPTKPRNKNQNIMQKQLQLNKQQQLQFSEELSYELEPVSMFWDDNLRAWYPTAIAALDYASIHSLQIPASKYSQLFEKKDEGLNMNVIAILANNLDLRTPDELGMTAKEWINVIRLNTIIGKKWELLAAPIRNKLIDRYQIIQNKPAIQIVGKA